MSARSPDSSDSTCRIVTGAQAAQIVEVGQGVRAVADRPGTRFAATLGSCVALCLHDVTAMRGGMNHIFQCVDPGPMGAAAIVSESEALVNALLRRGSRRVDLVARMAGGAHLRGRGRDHGREIARAVLDYLTTERIPLLQKDVGGMRARRILFDPVAGRMQIALIGTRDDLPAIPPRLNPMGPELF